MARRGRKRVMDAKRRATTTAGRMSSIAPTAELIDHRCREHGMPHIGTEHPLDAMAEWGLLSEQFDGEVMEDWIARNRLARDVGIDLYGLHRAVFGADEPQAVDLNNPIGSGAAAAKAPTGEDSDADIGRAQRYRTLTSLLRTAGTRVHHVTMNVVVYRRKLPDSIDRPLTYSRTLEALRRGLALLVEARRQNRRGRSAS